MSFRQSYANLKPIATIVIVIANDSTLRHPTLSVITSRVKLFGAGGVFLNDLPARYITVQHERGDRVIADEFGWIGQPLLHKRQGFFPPSLHGSCLASLRCVSTVKKCTAYSRRAVSSVSSAH